MAAMPLKAWYQVSCSFLRSTLKRHDLKEMMKGVILAKFLEPKQQEDPLLVLSSWTLGKASDGGRLSSSEPTKQWLERASWQVVSQPLPLWRVPRFRRICESEGLRLVV